MENRKLLNRAFEIKHMYLELQDLRKRYPLHDTQEYSTWADPSIEV
jgi:hypothetical protein